MKPQTSLANPNDKRRAANQRNSEKSTGPKTEEGKQVSAQNALRFGFFSTKALLPGESAEEFAAFHAAILQEFGPRNAMESHLVEQYIPLAWRLRRLPEIEAFAFTRYGLSVQGNQCGPGFALVASVQTDNILGQLARYEATLRRSAFKYLDLLRTLRKDAWDLESPAMIETKTEALELTPPRWAPTSPDVNAAEVAPESVPPTEPLAERPDPVTEPGNSECFKTNPNSDGKAELPEDQQHE